MQLMIQRIVKSQTNQREVKNGLVSGGLYRFYMPMVWMRCVRIGGGNHSIKPATTEECLLVISKVRSGIFLWQLLVVPL